MILRARRTIASRDSGFHAAPERAAPVPAPVPDAVPAPVSDAVPAPVPDVSAAGFAFAGRFTDSPAGRFVAFFGRIAPCSPTAESRPSDTPSAPLACALTGDLDTRPA
ncbi:hypothetical protein GCM10010433_39950 [Streptomyces pulveraceus]